MARLMMFMRHRAAIFGIRGVTVSGLLWFFLVGIATGLGIATIIFSAWQAWVG
jgi:hypothetical protein